MLLTFTIINYTRYSYSSRHFAFQTNKLINNHNINKKLPSSFSRLVQHMNDIFPHKETLCNGRPLFLLENSKKF